MNTGNALLCSLRFTEVGKRILNKVKDSRFRWNLNQGKKNPTTLFPGKKYFKSKALFINYQYQAISETWRRLLSGLG